MKRRRACSLDFKSETLLDRGASTAEPAYRVAVPSGRQEQKAKSYPHDPFSSRSAKRRLWPQLSWLLTCLSSDESVLGDYFRVNTPSFQFQSLTCLALPPILEVNEESDNSHPNIIMLIS